MPSLLTELAKKAKTKTSLTDIYKVDMGTRMITMSLKIGAPGQQGLSRASLGSKRILVDHNGSVKDQDIATNKEANGKFLTVKTVVTDIKGKPDDTMVDFTLKGGKQGEYNTTLSKTVMQDGESVLYDIKIFFFK